MYGSTVSARPASTSSAASDASRALTNASYIPSPVSGSTSPAASPTSSARPRAGDEAGPPQRQPVPAHVLERVGVDLVAAAELGEVLAERSAPRRSQPPTPTLTWSPFGKTQP